VKVAVYIIGEYGDILVNNSVQVPDNETIVVSEDEVMELLSEVFYKKYSNSTIKEYLLNCFVKLSVKYRNSIDKIQSFIELETKSYHCEVQQRAIEYSVFTRNGNSDLKRDIVKNIPNSKIVREIDIKK
jgi:AP-1 complex subunit gamma-1